MGTTLYCLDPPYFIPFVDEWSKEGQACQTASYIPCKQTVVYCVCVCVCVGVTNKLMAYIVLSARLVLIII